VTQRLVPLGRPAKYPWEEWTNGEEWTLKEGVHFECTAESFYVLLRRTARVHGLEVSASRFTIAGGKSRVLEPGNYVQFQFIKAQEERPGLTA
jgi:hypothetical protein